MRLREAPPILNYLLALNSQQLAITQLAITQFTHCGYFDGVNFESKICHIFYFRQCLIL